MSLGRDVLSFENATCKDRSVVPQGTLVFVDVTKDNVGNANWVGMKPKQDIPASLIEVKDMTDGEDCPPNDPLGMQPINS